MVGFREVEIELKFVIAGQKREARLRAFARA